MPHWYADGTFDTAPKLFKQLFTLNVIVKGKNLPMLYALLQNKQEKTYEELFLKIFEFIETCPKSVMCDFEKAIHNAMKRVAKDKFQIELIIQGCYFHLISNLWKHVQSNGLTDLFSDSKEFRHLFRLLKALAFLPPQHVVYGFTKIKSISMTEFLPILNYFEEYYIGILCIEDCFKITTFCDSFRLARIKNIFCEKISNVWYRGLERV